MAYEVAVVEFDDSIVTQGEVEGMSDNKLDLHASSLYDNLRNITRRTVVDSYNIGLVLTEMKKRATHGTWYDKLKSLGILPRNAQRFTGIIYNLNEHEMTPLEFDSMTAMEEFFRTPRLATGKPTQVEERPTPDDKDFEEYEKQVEAEQAEKQAGNVVDNDDGSKTVTATDGTVVVVQETNPEPVTGVDVDELDDTSRDVQVEVDELDVLIGDANVGEKTLDEVQEEIDADKDAQEAEYVVLPDDTLKDQIVSVLDGYKSERLTQARIDEIANLLLAFFD